MFCQLCGQPLSAKSTNVNMCEACATALNSNSNTVVPTQINPALPNHLRSNADWLKPTPPSATSTEQAERKHSVQQFLRSTANSKPPSNTIFQATNPNLNAPPIDAPPAFSKTRTEKIEICGVCGRPFPVSQIFQVTQRQSLLRPTGTSPTCTACLAQLRQKWQVTQTYNNRDLVLAMLVGLTLNIGLLVGWAWASAHTYQVTVFAIMLIGLITARAIKIILRGRKGPIPGLISGVMMGFSLVLAFYFLYSQMGGSLAADWTDLTESVQKNGIPFQTIIYFGVAWLIAVLSTLALEPLVRNQQGERIRFNTKG